MTLRHRLFGASILPTILLPLEAQQTRSFAEQLVEAALERTAIRFLQPRQIDVVTSIVSAGTLKNRVAHLRWWAEKSARQA